MRAATPSSNHATSASVFAHRLSSSCELSWLDSPIASPKANVADALEALRPLGFADRGQGHTTTTTRADFADCLIGRMNQARGCQVTVTFDKSLRTLPAFELL